MDKNEYVAKAHDPASWLECAMVQKMVADKILDAALEGKVNTKLWINAHYHYGLGIENGLKGLIIKQYPDTLKIKEIGDRVILKSIGSKGKLTHDLLELADEAGVFEKNIGTDEF